MALRIPFTKMHGLGNDFVMLSPDVVQQLALHPDRDSEDRLARLAVYLCDRHMGIGADGLIFPVAPTDAARFAVRFVYLNSDGSRAEMCGNGIRCFARFVTDHGLVRADSFAVETPAGLIRPQVHADQTVSVDMGPPVLTPAQIPFAPSPGDAPLPDGVMNYPLPVLDTVVPVTPVSMGNPHCLVFQEDLPRPLDPARFGPALETHAAFPAKTNVEFVETLSPTQLRVTVWERGCGFTQACGTGACATAVGAMRLGKADSVVTVMLPGGDLEIRWGGNAQDSVMMRGPATYVFNGEIELPVSLVS